MNNAEFINTEDYKRKHLLKSIIQARVESNIGVKLSTVTCLSILSYLDLNKQLFLRTYTVQPNESLNHIFYNGYSSKNNTISRYIVTPIIGEFDVCYRKNKNFIGVTKMYGDFGIVSLTVTTTGINNQNQYSYAIKTFLIFLKEDSNENKITNT